MSGSSRLLSGTRRTCDGIDSDVVSKQTSLCQWQQSELYAGGKTTRVCQVLALCYLFTMCLWQSIHIVVVALDAEVLCQVYYLHVGRDGVFLQESLTLAMTEAEEHHVNLVERHLAGELQFCLAHESLMHVIYLVAGI